MNGSLFTKHYVTFSVEHLTRVHKAPPIFEMPLNSGFDIYKSLPVGSKSLGISGISAIRPVR